jgi:hypothetical protein
MQLIIFEVLQLASISLRDEKEEGMETNKRGANKQSIMWGKEGGKRGRGGIY